MQQRSALWKACALEIDIVLFHTGSEFLWPIFLYIINKLRDSLLFRFFWHRLVSVKPKVAILLLLLITLDANV